MRTTSKRVILSIAMAVAFAAISAALSAAVSPMVRIGIVGQVVEFKGNSKPSSAQDAILSLTCDSLYRLDPVSNGISPMLAESWPSFDEKDKSVTVTLRKDRATLPLPFEADTIIGSLQVRIIEGNPVAISSEIGTGKVVFKFTSDPSAFWSVFAFAPLWVTNVDGGVTGAGSPPYRVEGWQPNTCYLAPNIDGAPGISISGYNNTERMVEAYSSGDVDYIKTKMTKYGASVKGPSVQSDAPAVTALAFNPKSAVFGEKALRAAAFEAMDIGYLVLRTLQGTVNRANGIYFATAAPSNGSNASMSGKRVTLLVDSTDKASLEMMCAAMIKTWWEKSGAIVSVVMPKTDADLSAYLKSGLYDAVVSTIWLEPAFRALARSGAKGSMGIIDCGSWSLEGLQQACNVMASASSYASLLEAAVKVEKILISEFAIVPLIRPVVSELYRGSILTSHVPAQGAPMIASLRNIGGFK